MSKLPTHSTIRMHFTANVVSGVLQPSHKKTITEQRTISRLNGSQKTNGAIRFSKRAVNPITSGGRYNAPHCPCFPALNFLSSNQSIGGCAQSMSGIICSVLHSITNTLSQWQWEPATAAFSNTICHLKRNQLVPKVEMRRYRAVVH